ncbi:MAG: PorV/PorQ family protein [candidate division KSB1 bacterium]|nr:PorV/PorQ family protein [candidate division KSB1 bacterium]MDZ7407025.1 PorV/PorQ family protein [candidate division KSB1 bacterium]
MKKIFFLIVVIALAPIAVHAQFSTPTEGFNNNGTRAAQFLKLAVGARASAMGESFAAVANDASALFWNPAGIGNLRNLEVHLTHMDYLLDIRFDFAGLVVPIGNGNLGFSAAVLGMDDENVTTLADPDGESGITWKASSFAVGMTYSRAITDRFAVGLTGKYIQENLYNSSANTLALDIGSLYNTGIRGIKIGMAMSNFGGKMKLGGRDLTQRDVDADPGVGGNIGQSADLVVNSWPLPLNFRVGLSLEVFKNESGTLLLAADFNHPTDADERVNFGAEYSFANRLFLRGGYKLNYDEESYTFGGGLNLPITNYNFMLDYSFNEFGILGETHRFSLGFRL